MSITFFVAGIPKGAGSKNAFPIRKKFQGDLSSETRDILEALTGNRYFYYTGQVAMVDSSGKAGREWRQAVHAGAFEAMAKADMKPFDEPLILRANFIMPRPKNHFRTGKFSGQLRDDAPCVHISQPDKSKLERAIEDSMTGIVYVDDSIICESHVYKFYGERTGCEITICPLSEQDFIMEYGQHLWHVLPPEGLLPARNAFQIPPAPWNQLKTAESERRKARKSILPRFSRDDLPFSLDSIST